MYEYRAFGEQLKRWDAANNETADKAKYSYGGKELDAETNLYYFNARYYDATIGRFINVDPIQDGTNWYVYCSNNPLSFVDPTGLRELMYDDVNGNAVAEGDRQDIQIVIGRQTDSYKSLENKNTDTPYSTDNTSLDTMYVINKTTGESLTLNNIQTVANHPRYDSGNTIAPGKFESRYVSSCDLFSPTDVLVTNDTMTRDGRQIGNDGRYNGKGDRWLTHSNRGAGNPEDWNVKASGGCFMPSYDQQMKLMETIRNWNVKSGTEIPTTLIEIQSHAKMPYNN